ncbi:GLPGLI family protein [Ancylomarina sp.]|uniref:GLPGLI family protein n=1 Tax=Ancylomarina sp. TaxID=1970196 RepID=UPI003566BBF0
MPKIKSQNTKTIYRILLILVLAITCTSVYSQNKIENHEAIDTAYLSCEYLLEYSKNKNDILDKRRTIMTLDIGNKSSKFYSEDYQKKDSMYYSDVNYIPPMEIFANRSKYISKAPSYSIFKKIPESESLTYCSKLVTDYYRYLEKSKFEWQLTQEKDTILEYPCLKATCEFSGRKYIAWFTTEIPVSDGPWKFHGTPGLILSVADSEGHYSFQCVGIKQIKNKKKLIHIPERDYMDCKKRKFIQLENRCLQDAVKFINTTSEVTVTRISPQNKPSAFIYNPIEL